LSLKILTDNGKEFTNHWKQAKQENIIPLLKFAKV
jgi:hypothetical protein